MNYAMEYLQAEYYRQSLYASETRMQTTRWDASVLKQFEDRACDCQRALMVLAEDDDYNRRETVQTIPEPAIEQAFEAEPE